MIAPGPGDENRAREGTNARRGGVDVGWGRWDAR